MPAASDGDVHHRLTGTRSKQLPDLPREYRKMPTGFDLSVVVFQSRKSGGGHTSVATHTPPSRTRAPGSPVDPTNEESVICWNWFPNIRSRRIRASSSARSRGVASRPVEVESLPTGRCKSRPTNRFGSFFMQLALSGCANRTPKRGESFRFSRSDAADLEKQTLLPLARGDPPGHLA
jgi:hypothetical protein